MAKKLKEVKLPKNWGKVNGVEFGAEPLEEIKKHDVVVCDKAGKACLATCGHNMPHGYHVGLCESYCSATKEQASCKLYLPKGEYNGLLKNV